MRFRPGSPDHDDTATVLARNADDISVGDTVIVREPYALDIETGKATFTSDGTPLPDDQLTSAIAVAKVHGNAKRGIVTVAATHSQAYRHAYLVTEINVSLMGRVELVLRPIVAGMAVNSQQIGTPVPPAKDIRPGDYYWFVGTDLSWVRTRHRNTPNDRHRVANGLAWRQRPHLSTEQEHE
jgi:hypothetical protein